MMLLYGQIRLSGLAAAVKIMLPPEALNASSDIVQAAFVRALNMGTSSMYSHLGNSHSSPCHCVNSPGFQGGIDPLALMLGCCISESMVAQQEGGVWMRGWSQSRVEKSQSGTKMELSSSQKYAKIQKMAFLSTSLTILLSGGGLMIYTK